MTTTLCDSCHYLIGNYEKYVTCVLTSVLIKPDVKDGECEFYNRDLSDEKICFNCKYFLGNAGDWGLCCSKHYYKLPTALSEICDDFKIRNCINEIAENT